MSGLVLALVLAAPFPLPSIDGKPLAVTASQRTFRLPMRFEKVKKFYTEQVLARPGVAFRETGVSGQRVLTLSTSAKGDPWTRAVVRERETETVVEVTPVLVLDAEAIEGTAPRPLVQFVIGRSADVQKAVEGIDHTEAVRK